MSHKVIKLKKENLLSELYPFLINSESEYYVRHILKWSYFPVNPLKKTENNNLVNMGYLENKKMYDKYMEEKDYDGIMVLLDKQTRMWWFIQNYKRVYRDLGDEKFYKLFRSNLVYVDSHYSYKKYYSKIISLGRDPKLMMSKKEQKQLDKLPETFTIYRGVSSDKIPSSSNVKKLLGNSWTNDKKISDWFSRNHSPKFTGCKYYIILSYQISKDEIISYFTDRKEKEIFIDYSKIDTSKVKWEITKSGDELYRELE